jgi:tetratricopeptide (TPR) repeat protein
LEDKGALADTDADPATTTSGEATTSGGGDERDRDTDTLSRVAKPEPPLAAGTRVGRFVILEPLGQGGMGVVYAAYDAALDRRVAVKLLRAGVGGQTYRAERRARLLREAQAMARVAHPNVIAVYEVGTALDGVFVAMEFAPGGTLGAWVKAEPRPWREVLRRFLEAGRGLAAAHAAGLVHRDFKPENVLLDQTGRPRVTDFGLARAALGSGETSAPEGSPRPPSGDSSTVSSSLLATPLTQHGLVVGTPAYMAPEQHAGHPTDVRTDEFSFAAALYEALYRTPAFEPRELAQGGDAAAGAIREPPSSGPVPGWVGRVLRRGLAVRPDDRFPTLDALLDALATDPIARRRRRLGGVAALLLLAAVVAGLVHRRDPRPPLCQGTEALPSGVWDPSVADQVRRAFAATGRSYAQSTFAVTADRLDRYAREWAAMRREACEATRIRGDQSEEIMTLRMLCLDRRREQLGALGAALAQADTAVLEQAPRAAASLLPVADCADIAALRRDEHAPRDEAQRALRAEIEKALAKANEQFELGRYPDALAGIQLILSRLGSAEPRLRAEALLIRGRVYDFESRNDEASAAYDDAVAAAEQGQYPLLAARAHARRAQLIVCAMQPDPQAERSATHAQAVSEGLGGEPLTELWVANARACAELLARRPAAAHAILSAALAAAERHLPGHEIDKNVLRQNIALAAHDEGKEGEALAALREVAASSERLLGPHNPRLGIMFANLAGFLRMAGRYDEAISVAERIIQLRRTVASSNDSYLYEAYTALLSAHSEAGHRREVLALLPEYRRLLDTIYPPGHPFRAREELRLSAVLIDLREYQAVVDLARPALRRLPTTGPASPARCFGTIYLAIAERELGHRDVAISLLERSLPLCHELNIPGDLANAQFTLAMTLGPRPQDRAHAREVALEARHYYATVHHGPQLEQIDHWLAAHPSPPR